MTTVRDWETAFSAAAGCRTELFFCVRPKCAICIAILVSGSICFAQEQPQVLPARDVDITYQVTRTGQPATTERRRWSAFEHIQRVDAPNKSATIFNRARNEFTLLNPANKTYLTLEGSPRMPLAPGKGVELNRDGEATIAKLQCVDWSWMVDTERHTACLTTDGVLLRLVIDGRTILLAQSVKYAQQPLTLFEIPKGYQPALAPEGGQCPETGSRNLAPLPAKMSVVFALRRSASQLPLDAKP